MCVFWVGWGLVIFIRFVFLILQLTVCSGVEVYLNPKKRREWKRNIIFKNTARGPSISRKGKQEKGEKCHVFKSDTHTHTYYMLVNITNYVL